eukprot:4267841-Alexandrium_andersonii.AAC.1
MAWRPSGQEANKASVAARVSLTELPWDWNPDGPERSGSSLRSRPLRKCALGGALTARVISARKTATLRFCSSELDYGRRLGARAGQVPQGGQWPRVAARRQRPIAL